MAILNFDARTVAPDQGVECIPEGWYDAAIDESSIMPTSDSTGAYLKLRYNILGPNNVGKKVFTRLNIRNNNPTAQEIAYKQLSAIAHAVNVLVVEDSQQLHGLPMKIKVKVRKGGPKLDKTTNQPTGEMYEDSNEITTYKNVNEAVPANAAPTAMQQHQAALPVPQGAPTMPWAPAAPPAGQMPWAPAPAAAPPQFAPQQPAPVQQQAAPQFAPPVQQQAPTQQQAPAAPWGQPPVQQAAPVQQAPVHQPPAPAAAPWAAQPAEQAPQQAPQQAAQQPQQQFAPPQQQQVAAAPPWAQQPAGAAPAWAQPPQG